jgi:hypothetical protein
MKLTAPVIAKAVAALAALALLQPQVARAGEAHYLLMFAYQRAYTEPEITHTFAVFARARWDGPCPAEPTLEYHTISWLPVNGIFRALAHKPEVGRNFGLHETIRLAQANRARVSLWGPYPIKAELYARAVKRVAELEGGTVRYKALDFCYPADRVSNCVRAVSALADGPSVRVPSPGWGEVAGYAVLLRLRPWVVEETPQHWVGAALGLGEYPIIYRERLTGPRTGPLGILAVRLFGPERNLNATYGPPR